MNLCAMAILLSSIDVVMSVFVCLLWVQVLRVRPLRLRLSYCSTSTQRNDHADTATQS